MRQVKLVYLDHNVGKFTRSITFAVIDTDAPDSKYAIHKEYTPVTRESHNGRITIEFPHFGANNEIKSELSLSATCEIISKMEKVVDTEGYDDLYSLFFDGDDTSDEPADFLLDVNFG